MKRILTLTVVAMIVLTLPACKLYNYNNDNNVQEYAIIATDGSDLAILDNYPNLQYVDLRGSTCYEDILDYSATHPNVKIRFTIDLCQQSFDHDVAEIKLHGTDANFEDLLHNLKYFPSLKAIHIDDISITHSQLEELKATYPQIHFTNTVRIGNESYDTTLTELNLSAVPSGEVDQMLTALEFFPNLSSVDLMNTSSSSPFSFADVGKIMQTYPNLSINYQFRLFGRNLSTQTQSLTYVNTTIGNAGLNQIREALSVMPNCTDIRFDNCKIDNEAMGKFREEFPNINIVWRVFVDQYSVLTDTEVVSMRYIANGNEAESLRYCNNVKYLDLTGSKIRNFEFLSNMPNLECAVLQGTFFSDLSVLQKAQKLTWLNLANCSGIRDVSSLSGLPNLKYLNLSATKVKDISPLDELPLERFKCAKTSIRKDVLDDFIADHPNCLTTNIGSVVGKGWRYNDLAQKEPFEYYQQMMKIFGYEH